MQWQQFGTVTKIHIPKQSKILSSAGNGFGAIQRAYTKTLEEDRTYYIVVRSSTKNAYTKNLKYKNRVIGQNVLMASPIR